MTAADRKTPFARIRNRTRISGVWIIPLVALGIGLWMVYHTYSTRGPVVSITFARADGVEAGKTKIKTRNVEMGRVMKVALGPNQRSVIITARMTKAAEPLLKDDSRFWIVKPRVGVGEISGLGTLVSGAYIEMAPGKKKSGQRQFQGLDEIPVTSPDEPGLHLTVTSRLDSSLKIGDPVLHRGFEVGRVEAGRFDTIRRQSVYNVFVRVPYDGLITTETRFWNAGGLDFKASAEGIALKTGTLTSLLGGGVAFDIPKDKPLGNPVTNGYRFRLFPDRASIDEDRTGRFLEYILLVDDSVRGLTEDAPVEYRGIRVGTVQRISLDFYDPDEGTLTEYHIPVLIHIELARIGIDDTFESVARLAQDMEMWVENGLRARLKMGNLLTGKLYVDLDFQDDAPPATIGRFGGYATLPTVPGGLSRIEQRLLAILKKIERLPIERMLASTESTIQEAGTTLARTRKSLARLDKVLDQYGSGELPEAAESALISMRKAMDGFNPQSPVYNDMTETLNALRTMVNELQPLLERLQREPNAMVFGNPSPDDPQPEAQK